ncbi:MAG: cytochrome c oxidase subunit II [Opitutaceae bacterium]
MGRLPPLPPFIRKLCAFGAVCLSGLLVAGCQMGQMDGPQSTMLVDGPVARMQLDLFYLTLWVTLAIFIFVGGALAYAQFKFRERPGDDANDPPPQTHGHPVIEIGLIVLSTLVLVIIAIPTVRGIAYQEDTPDRENAMVIRVTGYQWWFKFEYPELGIVTANEMVIPTDRPIHLDLRTVDVIHSFWVPKLAGKKDLMPNRANHMWLLAEKSDYYWAQCAEYCGESHANMKFRVVSLEPAAFAEWEQRQRSEARTVDAAAAEAAALQPRLRFAAHDPAEDTGIAGAESPFAYWQQKQTLPEPGTEDAALIAQGRKLFQDKTCLGCHTIRGHNAMGISGPDLTHVGSRTTIASAMLENTPENLKRWLQHPDELKPGNLMYRDGYVPNKITISDDEAEALVAYLHSLK